MKWLLLALGLLSLALVIAGTLAFVFEEKTKPYIDQYANHASVFGFLVSVVGFILTVSAIFETLRVSRQSQRETAAGVNAVRTESRALLGKIRVKMMGDTCEQAYLFASEARHAIRSGLWMRAVEKCQDARILPSRLLSFQDVTEAQRTAIRAAVEDLEATIGFIERNRLKQSPPPGMPDNKVQPLDSLINELEKVRGRLLQQLLEVPYVDNTAN